MKEILIFAGTTEGRTLSECLSAAGIGHTVCVATEYGEIVLKEHPLVRVHCGRMDRDGMREYIEQGHFLAVVDATHPYAEAVSENIRQAMRGSDIPYLRLKRENGTEGGSEKNVGHKNPGDVVYYENHEACAEALKQVEGNILLTAGSKELAVYASSGELKSRLYVRVLPGMESLALCAEHGICGKQILALQGPFTAELNEAMIHQYRIRCLVTKKSGRAGGYPEKLEAAGRAGIPVFVVGQAQEQEGDSFQEVCHKLEMICGQTIGQAGGFDILLAGAGMGGKGCLTREVQQAVEAADLLFGAGRMIAGYQPGIGKKPFYRADQIIPFLSEMQANGGAVEKRKVVVLFSGDSGFYSGCQALYQALQAELRAGRLLASVRIMPGISSVAYFAACIGESYQDAVICSMHGKALPNLAGIIRREKKTFLLMSGVQDVNRLGQLLENAGLGECVVLAGYQLSYPEQRIMALTPQECGALTEEGLYTCCIRNPHAKWNRLTPGMADTEFVRDKVPMTKEEVREVSICKLKLRKEAVVYDIGSGTGSVAMEIAALSDDIKVFAIERKDAAVSLIERNRERFQLENIEIVKQEAPDGFSELPVPTHAFIGGSGGRLKEILSALYRMNPEMRVVVNAVSMETICEVKEILSLYPMEKAEIVQLQADRVKETGQYHLLQAENPIWICSFRFRRNKEKL